MSVTFVSLQRVNQASCQETFLAKVAAIESVARAPRWSQYLTAQFVPDEILCRQEVVVKFGADWPRDMVEVRLRLDTHAVHGYCHELARKDMVILAGKFTPFVSARLTTGDVYAAMRFQSVLDAAVAFTGAVMACVGTDEFDIKLLED